MTPEQIKAGRAYTSTTGRNERYVLEVGPGVRVCWNGSKDTEPQGEPGVRFLDTRSGKVHHGSSKGERTLYLSAFAAWAQMEVKQGREAAHG